MIRRQDDVTFETDTEAPVADVAEQHLPTDPVEIAETDAPAVSPAEADPADAADQAEAIALDDELRTGTTTAVVGPSGQFR